MQLSTGQVVISWTADHEQRKYRVKLRHLDFIKVLNVCVGLMFV